MKRAIVRGLVLVGVAAVAACDSPAGPELPDIQPGCNPLIGDDCLSPFPSSVYQVDDASTATGVRMAVVQSALPAPNDVPLDAARINAHDGVSPSTPFVVYFAAGVDATQLPSEATLADSITATSAVQVLDMDSGERVPVMAELDANVAADRRQALIIRPMTRLQPATHYAVALVGLNDKSGQPLVAPGFAAIRDGAALTPQLTAVAPHYADIFDAFATAGVDKGDITLAWDVVTASDSDSVHHLVSMRDQALGMVGSLSWQISKATDTPADPHRLREVIGTFDVPSYLADGTTLTADEFGDPVMVGMGSANFVVDIPQCAATATGPLPVIVFGHGLFGTAPDELGTDYEKQVGDFLCAVQIGTDWIGLSAPDFPVLVNDVLPDFNQLHIITDRLQQAHTNAQTLTRLFLTRMKDDPAFAFNGTPVTDGSEVYYYGISDGGIQGTTFMALSEDVAKGVVNVPGCEWNLMMFRSQDFAGLQAVLATVLPDPLDQQVLLAMMQPEFDTSDPAGFAPHVFGQPLPFAAGNKQLLVQEAVNDAQVPNIATHVLVRTLGVPGLNLEYPVFGVEEQAAPLPSAYTQWDVMPMPVPPLGDAPASDDNGAHEAVRRLVDVEEQIKAFLTPGGMVTETCGGPCACSLSGGTCEMPPGV